MHRIKCGEQPLMSSIIFESCSLNLDTTEPLDERGEAEVALLALEKMVWRRGRVRVEEGLGVRGL